MKLVYWLIRLRLSKKAGAIALALAEADREYSTLLTIYGRSAYSHAELLARKAGIVERLTLQLEMLNTAIDRLPPLSK